VRGDANYESKATRVTEWGTEHAALLGEPGDRVFAVVHKPRVQSAGVVLICSSLFTDTVQNYRRETELSRLLAANGLTVGRFHYRGMGHSEGDPLDATFSTMVTDAVCMIEHLGEGGRTRIVGLVGARWGALVAAGLAAQFEGLPIAVWEPALTGRSFLTEALQAGGVAHLTAGGRGLSPKRSLESAGVANILGFPMGRALYESGQQLSLVEQVGAGPREILYLASERNGAFPRSHMNALEELRSNGLDVTTEGVAGPASWWFVDDLNQTPLDAAVTTARWFAQALVAR